MSDESDPQPIEDEREELRAESVLLDRAIGGWRGLIDSGLPTMVFVVAYLASGSNLGLALTLALVAGALVAAWRMIRREPLQQIAAGFIGLAVSAFFSWKTGKAENVFLPGLLTNVVYGTAFLVSLLVRWPLLGVVIGYLTGDGTAWRSDQTLRRRYAAASWIWVGVFFGRLAVQLPFYFAGWVGVLGVLKVVMGWPLFFLGAYLTYRLLAPVWEERRRANLD